MQGKDLSNPNLIFSSPISKLLDSSNHRQSISTSVPQLNWFKKSATIQHNFTHSQGKLSWGCFRRTMSLNDRCNHSWCTTLEWQIWLPRDAMTTVIIMRWLDKSLSTTYEEWSKTLPCDEMLYSHLGRRSIPIITIIIIIIIIIIVIIIIIITIIIIPGPRSPPPPPCWARRSPQYSKCLERTDND